MPPELRKLFIRFIELGALLPHQDDFDTDDPRELAEQKLILREMQQVHNEMKNAPKFYKQSMRGNLNRTIDGLLSAGDINEPSKGNFALTAKAQQEIQAKL